MGAKRVILHIGLPKTGTSFVQSVLRDNAEALGRRDTRLPDVTRDQIFLGVLHVTDRARSWGRSVEAAAEAWAQIVAGVHARPGTVVLSSETLCLATPAQIERILGDLDGVRVEVVVSARDLARQVPGEWQESVKHGRRTAYPAFLDAVLPADPGAAPEGRVARRFWSAQDLPGILERWAAAVGTDRVHVVTCPRPGAPKDLLWRRFAEVAGVADVPIELPEIAVNNSLGRLQTEVLRRVNMRIARKEDVLGYGDVVKRLYAGTFLRGQGGEKVVLPAAYDEEVRRIGESWCEVLTSRGYHVVGDLADLVPQPRAVPPGPDRVRPADLLEVSLDATAELLAEVRRLRRENTELRRGPHQGPRRGLRWRVRA